MTLIRRILLLGMVALFLSMPLAFVGPPVLSMVFVGIVIGFAASQYVQMDTGAKLGFVALAAILAAVVDLYLGSAWVWSKITVLAAEGARAPKYPMTLAFLATNAGIAAICAIAISLVPALPKRHARTLTNRMFTVACWATAAVSILVLCVLFFSIGKQGIEYLGWDFIKGVPSRKPELAGMGPAIAGTIGICIVCALVALPLGVGTAVFLEEYRPRSGFPKKAHDFIQLNIANLAGVPSIVYGIIGLTVFVQLFGLSNPNHSDEPWWTVGVKWHDSFYLQQTDQYAQVRVDGQNAESTVLTAGATLTMFDDDGRELAVRIVEPDADLEAFTGPVLPADAVPFRIDTKAWYYVQIPFGRGVLAGGLTLMLVILPIVIVSSQESLRAVPDSLREGAFGLGATRWQMVRRMTLPAAVPGIMTGSILAMSRAIGEAAPILIIAGIVYITFTPKHLMDDFTAMPLQIYDWAGRPQESFHQVAASGIIVLLAVLLTFNSIAVLIRQKFQKPLS